MTLPSTSAINDRRIAQFKERITETLSSEDIGFFYQLVETYQTERNVSPLDIAAALAKLAQGDKPMLLKDIKIPRVEDIDSFSRKKKVQPTRGKRPHDRDRDMERYRIEVGQAHGVRQGNIVGAIANEAGLDSKFIGRIEIFENFSTVDLPKDLPKSALQTLKRVWVSGQKMNIARHEESWSKPAIKTNGANGKTNGKISSRSSNPRPRRKV